MHEIKLSGLQKDVLKFFAKSKFGQNFYWTGGTLLSYHYLHHRNSVDLDFFSDKLFSDEEYLFFINNLKKAVEADKISLIKSYNRRLYLVEKSKESIKLEMVYFPFPAIEKRKFIPEFKIKIDSLTDIMTNKILSAYQRNEPKDAFDIYYYLYNKPKYDLMKIIRLVEKKFGISIEAVMLLAKINKLIDGLDFVTPLLIKKQNGLGNKMRLFFQSIFDNLARKKIKK